MAYEVTATRKRPQTFDGLMGQEFVVSTIKNSIDQGRIAHAYLFSGPRGVGKTSSARLLAKALNCEHGPTPFPCGQCANCHEISQGSSMDVIEIDGASNTSVNDIRVIKDEVLFPPQGSRYKIYIIDEVHMLSTSAFNALLKTIEEPPAYVVFIFATTETQKVPATIRSRCQQFHFQLLPLETIRQLLEETAQEMGILAEPEALFWIAKEATGSMRDAYTLFDQVASFSEGAITLEKIHRKLGLVGIDQLSRILSLSLAKEDAQAIEAVQDLLAAGVSVEQCIKDLAEYFRTLLFLRKGIRNEDLLGVQLERIPEAIVNAYNQEQLEAALEMFLQLYRDIRFSLNPRFELELAISRLGSLPYLVSSVTLMQRLATLKNDLIAGRPSDISPARETMEIPITIPQKPLQTPSIAPQVAKQDTVVAKPVIPQPSIAQPAVPPLQVSDPTPTPTPTPTLAPVKAAVATPASNPVAKPAQARPTMVSPAPANPIPVSPATVSPVPAKPSQVPSPLPGKVTKDIIPMLIQEMANARDPAGIILSQIVDIIHTDQALNLVFSSQFALSTAKQDEEKLRQLINKIAGYHGRLLLSLAQPKTASKVEEKQKSDLTVQNIASLFRGEIV
ncbi:MAG: DNA polymerase III subunit gamma/tau [Sphaerochaetaceae bacterium]